MPTAPAASRPTLDQLSADLEALLDAYTARYEQWRSLLLTQREAVRRADGAGVEQASRALSNVLEAIAMLESRRGELINACAEAIPGLCPARSGAITLHDVATALPGPGRAALESKACALRELARDVHARTQSIAGATRSLLGHVEGLMRHVARSLSHSGTYSRSGVVEAGGAVVSALDVRT